MIDIFTSISGDSFINRMNPTIKILSMIALCITISLVGSFSTILLLTMICVGIIIVAKISAKRILKMFGPLWLFILFVFIMNLFYTDSASAFIIAIKFSLFVFVSSALICTTTETELENGLSAIISPLEKLRVPTRDIAFVISAVLRFIPVLSEEYEKIRLARISRGIAPEQLSIVSRAKITFSGFMPLFANAFLHAESLGMAMESRGYGLPIKKARKHYALSKTDVLSLGIIVLSCIFLVLLEFLH